MVATVLVAASALAACGAGTATGEVALTAAASGGPSTDPSPEPTYREWSGSCQGHHAMPGDLDADGRDDLVAHYWDEDGIDGVSAFITVVCLADGRLVTEEGLGAEAFDVVDVDLDGRAEVLGGGTAASNGGMTLYALDGAELRPVTLEGAPFEVIWGIDRLAPGVEGRPEASSAWGCADVVDRPGREVIQVSDDYVAHRRIRRIYSIDGLTAELVEERVEVLDEKVTFESEDAGGLLPQC